MQAAAVIPAPIAYIKVVAVKKLVVEFLVGALPMMVYSIVGEVPVFFMEVAYLTFTGRVGETILLL